MKEYKPNMLKAIVISAMVLLAGAAAPTANAGTYCDQLGDNPSVAKAERVMWDILVSAATSGADPQTLGTAVATDIVYNCPQAEPAVTKAINNIDRRLDQMGG